MVAPIDPNGINKAGAPASLDHSINNWGYIFTGHDKRRVLLGVVLAAGAFFGVILLAFLLIRFGGNNIHANTKAGFLRSAELSPSALEDAILHRGVRSVVRLVGTDERNIAAYEDEVAVCRRLGVPHFTTKMAATRLPYRSELGPVFAALDTIAASSELQPVLIHCNAGSDRTGLISVIWLHDYQGVPLAEARKELAFGPYMHVDMLGPASMGEFLDMYQAHLKSNPRISIQQWVRDHYNIEKPGRETAPWPVGNLAR